MTPLQLADLLKDLDRRVSVLERSLVEVAMEQQPRVKKRKLQLAWHDNATWTPKVVDGDASPPEPHDKAKDWI